MSTDGCLKAQHRVGHAKGILPFSSRLNVKYLFKNLYIASTMVCIAVALCNMLSSS